MRGVRHHKGGVTIRKVCHHGRGVSSREGGVIIQECVFIREVCHHERGVSS